MDQSRRNEGAIWLVFGVAFAIPIVITAVPDHRFSLKLWPGDGLLRVITWAIWLGSTGCALMIGLCVVAGGSLRDRAIPRRLEVAASLALLLVGQAAYMIAAHADQIPREPLPLLAAAAALALVVWALRREVEPILRSRFSAFDPSPGHVPDPDADLKGFEVPSFKKGPPASESRLSIAHVVLFLVALFLAIVAFAVSGLARKVLGPGMGDVMTASRPSPIFRNLSAYLKYRERRRGGADITAAFGPPPIAGRRGPDSQGLTTAHRALLKSGARVRIKGWVLGGAHVRIENDPAGRSAGEWGYVSLDDWEP